MSVNQSYEKGLIRTDRGEFHDKGNYRFDPRHKDFWDGAKGDGVRDDRDSIAKADEEAQLYDAGLIFGPGDYAIASDLTITSHCKFEPGAVVKPASGVTVTFDGGIDAGGSQIFDPANGTIAIGGSDFIRPEWWGAKGDGVTDDTDALQAALDSAAAAEGGKIYISTGTWAHTGLRLTAPQWNVDIDGAGPRAATLYNNSAAGTSFTVDGIHQLKVENVGFRGTPANTTGNGIVFSIAAGFQTFNFHMENCWIYAHGGNGVVGQPFSSTIRDCTFGGNSTDDASAGGTAHLGKNGIVMNAVLSCLIDSCWFADLQDGRTGILFQSGAQASVRNCNFSSETAGTTWYGIQVQAMGHVLIESNNFECDAVNTCNAGIQFLNNAWGGGAIIGNNFAPASGTIARDIWVTVNGAGDDTAIFVNGHSGTSVVDMGDISVGFVIGIPYVTPVNDANARYRGVRRGGLQFLDGYRQTISGWSQTNVTASQTAVVLPFGGGTATDGYAAVRGGSLTGIVVRSNAARTAGTLTVEAYINGTATGLSAVLDGTNTTTKATLQAKDLDTFVAGDEITLRITTDGSWAPTTADIVCSLEFET